MKRYFTAAKYSFLQQLQLRGQLVGRLFLFTVVLYIFHQVFQAVQAPPNRIWYYMVTDAIVLATTPLALQISSDIRTNHIVYFLLCPINYSFFRISEAMGEAIFRYFTLMLWGRIFISVLEKTFYVSWSALFFAFLIGILGIFLHTLISLFIGFLSYWVKDVKTLLYTHLTAAFCFGGLIVPIIYYNPIMQQACFWSPYPWILWWPASIVAGEQVDHLNALIMWMLWIASFTLLNYLVFKNYKNNLVIEGG
jgi:ABC-type uncharacterized transport system permease subunit